MPILILTYRNFYIQHNIQQGKLRFGEARFAVMLHDTEKLDCLVSRRFQQELKKKVTKCEMAAL